MNGPLISVTQEDISAGCRMSGNSCMIARALQRAFPDARVYASYGGENGEQPFAYVDDEAFIMTPEVGKKMVDFDKGQPVLPFSFRLKKGSWF